MLQGNLEQFCLLWSDIISTFLRLIIKIVFIDAKYREEQMKKRIMAIVIICFLCLAFNPVYSQDTKTERSQTLTALVLALQHNIGFKLIDVDPSLFSDDTSIIIIVPINKEIIDTSVAYRASMENLTETESSRLLADAYEEYINGKVFVFALFIINNNFNSRRVTGFVSFSENVFLYDEERRYNLIRYTHNFDSNLYAGWNSGYLYFPNFRHAKNNSYSVHFDGYWASGNSWNLGSWSFTFDETEIGFLSLLQNGLTESEIRQNYSIAISESSAIDLSTLLNIAGLILTFISMI